MALRDQPYLPLYIQDIMTDEKLNECSAATHGIYIKGLMCLMHKSHTYGKILLKQKYKQSENKCLNFARQLVKHLPYSVDEISAAISELIDEDVCHFEGDYICQRRMIKDNDVSEKRVKAGQKGGKFAQAKVKAKHQANSENEYEYENENENDNSLKKSEKTLYEKPIEFPFDSENFLLHWNIWKYYKKVEHKFKYKSSLSEQASLNKLNKLADNDEETAIEIIIESISNSWKGFFKLDNNGKTNKGVTNQELFEIFKRKFAKERQRKT